MKKNNQIVAAYGLLFFAIIFLDRITKYLMRSADTKYTLNDFITLTLQYNRGISWGMFDSENNTLFIVITIIIGIFTSFFFLYTFVSFMNKHTIVGELMVCAGALSNLIDRIWYGGVADFILISGSFWSWPVFNLADIFIVLGLGIMVLTGFIYHEK